MKLTFAIPPIKVTYVASICDFSSKNFFNLSAEMSKQMGIYCPRSPQNVPFYQCIADHFEEFGQVYDEQFEREYGFWRPVISEVIQKYLECGDLTHGFARIRCDHCGKTLLLALSCKGRYFCPSCHMKRVLSFSEWLTSEVLEEIPHQQ